MTESMHDGETTSATESRDQSRTGATSTVGNAAKPQVVQHHNRPRILSRDGWIGLVLLLSAVIATVSMVVIHRSNRQQDTPPAVGEQTWPPRSYLPLPTLVPNQSAPPTVSPTPRSSCQHPVWRDPGIFWRPPSEIPAAPCLDRPRAAAPDLGSSHG